jgi:hypothetical protein|tara:strand:- start:224 stop:463 length:240 start_codon:yes stop_codon:yes gene_type:complete
VGGSGQNKMLSNTGGFSNMITQGTGLHNNIMSNTGGPSGGSSGQQQQIRGFSPSKPKWKQAQGSNVMQYPIGQHRKIKY